MKKTFKAFWFLLIASSVILTIVFFKPSGSVRKTIEAGKVISTSNPTEFTSENKTIVKSTNDTKDPCNGKHSVPASPRGDVFFNNFLSRIVDEVASKWSQPGLQRSFNEPKSVTTSLQVMRDNYKKFESCSGEMTLMLKKDGHAVCQKGNFVATSDGKYRVEFWPEGSKKNLTISMFDGLVNRTISRVSDGTNISTHENSGPYSGWPLFTHSQAIREFGWQDYGIETIKITDVEKSREVSVKHLKFFDAVWYIDTTTNLLVREEYYKNGVLTNSVDYLKYSNYEIPSGSGSKKICYPAKIKIWSADYVQELSFENVKFDNPLPESSLFSNSQPIFFNVAKGF